MDKLLVIIFTYIANTFDDVNADDLEYDDEMDILTDYG